MFIPEHLLARKESLLKLIGYTGPALLVSMAYMDPEICPFRFLDKNKIFLCFINPEE